MKKFLVFFLTCAALRAVAPINNWNGNGTKTIGGLPADVVWSASVTKESQAGGSSITFAVNAGAVMQTSPTQNLSIRVGLNNGSTTVYSSDSRINIGGTGTFTVNVEVQYAGSWASVAPSSPSNQMDVAVERFSGMQVKKATIPLTYSFYDDVTGEKLSSVDVAAGDAPFLTASNTAHGITWTAAAKGKVWHPSIYLGDGLYSVAEWADEDGTDTNVAGGHILSASMMAVGQAPPTQGPVAGLGTVDPNAYVGAEGTVTVQPGANLLVKSTNTGAATGKEMADNANGIIAAIVSTSAAEKEMLAKIWAKTGSGGSGGGVATDMTATNTKIDAVKTAVEVVSALLRPADNAHEVPEDDANAQETAAGAFTTSHPIGGLPAGVGGTVTVPEAGSLLLYSQTLGGTNMQLGFREEDVARVSGAGPGVLTASRLLILAVLLVWLGRAAALEMKSYLVGLGSADGGGANAGIENVVPGVVQAKQVAQASIVTVAILVACAAMVALADAMLAYGAGAGGGSGGSLLTVFSTFNMTSAGPVMAIINRYVPVAAFITIALERAALPILLAPIYAACLATIKFVKP